MLRVNHIPTATARTAVSKGKSVTATSLSTSAPLTTTKSTTAFFSSSAASHTLHNTATFHTHSTFSPCHPYAYNGVPQRAFSTSHAVSTKKILLEFPKEPQPLINHKSLDITQGVKVDKEHNQAVVKRALRKLRRYAKKSDIPVERIAAVPEDLKVLGVRPPASVYRRTLLTLCSHGAGKAAFQVMQEMEKRSFRIRESHYCAVIEACLKEGKDAVTEGHNTFRRAMKYAAPSLKVFRTTIQLYARYFPRTDKARHIFDEMLAYEIRPDAETWTALMEMYQGRGDADGVRSVFERMVREGVEPDAGAYNQLLRAGKMPHDKQNVMDIFEEMREEGVLRTDETYTIIMEKMLTCQDHYRVQHYYRRMLDAQVQPNEDTLTVALQSAHDNDLDIRFARSVLHDSKRLRVPRTDVHMEIVRQIKRKRAEVREKEVERMQEEIREYRRQRTQKRAELLRAYAEEQKKKAVKLQKRK